MSSGPPPERTNVACGASTATCRRGVSVSVRPDVVTRQRVTECSAANRRPGRAAAVSKPRQRGGTLKGSRKLAAATRPGVGLEHLQLAAVADQHVEVEAERRQHRLGDRLDLLGDVVLEVERML